MKKRFTIIASMSILLVVPLLAQNVEKVDYDAIFKIKDEGFNRSQVMQTMSYLTDVYGPRLTNSPQIKQAAEWARKKLTEWELVNMKNEPWGPFGRGWSNERMFAAIKISGQSYPVIAYPKAWTPGTAGAISGDAVLAVIQNESDLSEWRGKLRGKYVLTAAMREVPAHFEPLGRRLTDEELAARDRVQVQVSGQRGGGTAAGGAQFNAKRLQFFVDEGVAGLIEPGNGDGGTVFVQSGGSRDKNGPPSPLQIVMAVEHYGRIVRTLEKKIPVTIEMDVQNKFYDDDLNSFNVIAEIPGTDKADELVMLGGHFDSWHTGTGATDNAAGSAVAMEAVRILKATALKMRRTVRIALWTGEEQGLLGSDAYVKEHFGDRHTMTLKPAQSKVSAYYQHDGGTGAIRGVSANGSEALAPVFRAWVEPFKSIGMTLVTTGSPRQPPTSIGGTDSTSFDAVGIPGIGFMQDPIEYGSRTHHSNMDVYERIQAPDLMKNAVIIASFVYLTANRDQLLPRKPLHKGEKGELPKVAGQR